MQRKIAIAIIVVITLTLLIGLGILWELNSVQVNSNPTIVLPLSPTSSPSSASTTPINAQPQMGINPTVIVALLALAGSVIAALITGMFAVYQLRRNTQMDRERRDEQFQHEQDMERLKKELEAEFKVKERDLEAQYRAKEQEDLRKANEAEELRLQMERAQNNAERDKAYRLALHAYPLISRLQILDMSRPLEVANVYVPVKVHEDVMPSYELDLETSSAEMQRDPNVLLQAGFKHLERRIKDAIDPVEAIRTHRCCVFVGNPGAGKTTLLKYLTLKAADNQLLDLPNVPIRIDLSAFASSGSRDLLAFAADEWDERYGFPKADARTYMEENLMAGNALLLLDALDETVIGDTTEEAEASYQSVADAIMKTATRYYQSPIVVTARKSAYQQYQQWGYLLGFTELEVLDFDREDIRQFVTHWFDGYQSPQKQAYATELNNILERNSRLQTLAVNPLLLSLIALVFEARLDLPDRRAELYKRCVDTLLIEWDAKRKSRRRRDFKPEDKRQVLAEIAWHFHNQGRCYFPESEVLSIIANFLSKVPLPPEQSRQVLAEIANEHGLLKEQARGWQGFLHLTLQEYFVAQYVIENHQLDHLLAHSGDLWWEEVVLLYAGLVPDVGPLLLKLLGRNNEKQIQEDLFQTNLLLAGQCLLSRPLNQKDPYRQVVIDTLFKTFEETPYSLIKEHIAEVLVSIDGSEVTKHLLKLLSNQQVDPSLCIHIADAIGKLGDRSVVPDLIRLLSNKQMGPFARGHVALAIGGLGERSIAPVLLELLSNNQVDTFVRGSIADALGDLGERSIAPDLVRLLSDSLVDVFVRKRIALALGNLSDWSVVLDLVGLLTNPQIDTFVRESIADALGNMEEHSVAPELVQLLSNIEVDVSVRERIADSLGKLQEHSVASGLVELLSNPQMDVSVRGRVALALGNIKDRSVAPKLVELLSNRQVDVTVQCRIADALSKLGERSVARDLVQLLSNWRVDMSVRKRIALALGDLGERSVAQDLVHLLFNKHVDIEVQEFIASALGSLDETSVVPDLLQLLSNKNISIGIRHNIASAIGKLADDEETVHSLAALIQKSDVADDIHRALWTVSRKARVRVIVVEGVLEIINW